MKRSINIIMTVQMQSRFRGETDTSDHQS